MLNFLLPGLLLCFDRYAKSLARKNTDVVLPLESHVKWQPMENPGLAGSCWKEHPKTVKAVHAASCGLLTAALSSDWNKKRPAERTGAWFLLLGAMSNLFDRLTRGTVTDMFRFPRAPGKLKSLVFNAADFMLAIGMALSFISRLFRKKI